MFKYIVESVLNEIDAKNAYQYYNEIPEKDFFDIVSLYGGKYDNFIKFLMDSIKNGISDVAEAKEIVKRYKETNDNNIRILIKNKIKNNEYYLPIEILEEISFFSKFGLVTEKSLSDEGFLNIYEDNKYKITFTATYNANHHYFNSCTTWCTASDRKGRYDGYQMFDQYSMPRSSRPLPLIQIYKKENKELYQVVLNNSGFGLCCDSQDHTVNFKNDVALPEELCIFLIEKYPSLAQIEKQLSNKEYNFEENKNNSKRVSLPIEKFELIKERCQVLNQKKYELASSKFNKLKSSNLLKNVNFLNELLHDTQCFQYRATSLTQVEKYEEIAKKFSYAQAVLLRKQICNYYTYILEISNIPGKIFEAVADEKSCNISQVFSARASDWTRNVIYILVRLNEDNMIENILGTLFESETLADLCVNSIYEKFFTISHDGITEVISISNLSNKVVLPYTSNDFDIWRHGIIEIDYSGSHLGYCEFIDTNTMKRLGTFKIIDNLVDGYKLFYNEEEQKLIIPTQEGMNTFKYPLTSKVSNFYVSSKRINNDNGEKIGRNVVLFLQMSDGNDAKLYFNPLSYDGLKTIEAEIDIVRINRDGVRYSKDGTMFWFDGETQETTSI